MTTPFFFRKYYYDFCLPFALELNENIKLFTEAVNAIFNISFPRGIQFLRNGHMFPISSVVNEKKGTFSQIPGQIKRQTYIQPKKAEIRHSNTLSTNQILNDNNSKFA